MISCVYSIIISKNDFKYFYHFCFTIEWTYDNNTLGKYSFLTWIQRSSWFSAEGSHLWILFWLVNLLKMIKGRIWFDSQGMAPFSPTSTSRSKTDNAIQIFPYSIFSKVINYMAQSSKLTPHGRLSTQPCWDERTDGGPRWTLQNQSMPKSLFKSRLLPWYILYLFICKLTNEDC